MSSGCSYDIVHFYLDKTSKSANPYKVQKSWQLRHTDSALVASLSGELGVSKTTARILVSRKLATPEAAKLFLDMPISSIHKPDLLKDMDRAVARTIKAIHAGEKICIYGDYDVDGAVATSLLLIFFRDLGLTIDFYIPNRLIEGYSLNNLALDRLKARGINLIITVDNGIMALNEVDYAHKLGMDVVITDHHQVGASLPNAAAVVNPQRKDCTYPFKGICGAGVAYKLMLGLRQALRESGYFATRTEPNLKQYLDLLCIPTVCDVVPLVDENRLLVKEGLKHLSRTKRPGLKALMKVCALENRDVTAYDLGFKFGPRINACGRLEDASLGVRLLTSENEAEALILSKRLDVLNRERRELEQTITAEALVKITKEVDLESTLGLVLYDPNWHIGVVGIVASRLVERFKRPIFVLANSENGFVKGSGRSIAGVSLISALNACRDNLKIYGGHEAAAGVTLEPSQISHFVRNFDDAIKNQMTRDQLTRPTLIDDELNIETITDELVRELSLLEPFGMGNAKPIFAASGLKIHSKKIVGESHLKLKVGDDKKVFDAIAFNKSEDFKKLSGQTGLVFGLEINEFNNVESVQLVVKDFF